MKWNLDTIPHIQYSGGPTMVHLERHFSRRARCLKLYNVICQELFKIKWKLLLKELDRGH